MPDNYYRALLLAVCVLIGGCVGQPDAQFVNGAPAGDLLDGNVFGVAPDAEPPDPQLLAVNEDMRAFLREHVPDNASPSRKVDLILQGILSTGLQLQYDNLLTLSAEDAFYRRAGNCMSFTNLFLALAREAGLRAHYQEVMVPPSWTSHDSTWFYNLHVNVLVDLPGASQIVDFNLENYMASYPRQQLSDAAGESRHHNNLGVHWMTQSDAARAFSHFRRAIVLQPEAGHVWTNLGTLYRREGHLDLAEAAFLRAVELDREPVAMGNLARMYAAEGLPELAAHYTAQTERFRAKNPYYQYYLAEEAYAGGDYRRAQRRLQKAIATHAYDHRFHHLMAMTLIQRGEPELARRFLEQAQALASSQDKARYSHKLELLAGN